MTPKIPMSFLVGPTGRISLLELEEQEQFSPFFWGSRAVKERNRSNNCSRMAISHNCSFPLCTPCVCQVREEIKHGILMGRSAKPGSLSVDRKEAPYGSNQVATFPLHL
ncbi:hypothetical protein L1987_30434 [Smallanthus sonchifolius]|uniref:Uncharacterized protein n=1 Tax=Smallanthus sonchifolius TaxID=185202 RepID=A0ACB9I2R2_9ASTR|nr:hypothetical protein L1987_30434 [Smallanthus sonchifolius]